MRTKWYGLMLAAAIGWTATIARPTAAAPAKEDSPPPPGPAQLGSPQRPNHVLSPVEGGERVVQKTPPAGPKATVKPQSAETRPGTPEDEALKRLIGQRRSTKGITLSSGPLARPHKVVGAVSVEAPTPKGETETKPGPNLYLNEMLRSEAVKLYGEKNVDAIMNITYTPAAAGKLKASGTAVRFEEQSDKKK